MTTAIPTNTMLTDKKTSILELFNIDDFLPDTSLVCQIVNKVSQLVETLDLPPGELIPEKEIADSLGISKTPVREAFVRLEGLSYITVVPRVGTYINAIDVTAYLEACFLRKNLEFAAVRNAALSFNEQHKRALLEPILAQQKIALENDAKSEFYKLDQALHKAFFEIAGVPGVWNTILRSQIDVNRIRHIKDELGIHNNEDLLEEHQAIVNAICKGNSVEACEALMKHLVVLDDDLNRLGNFPELLKCINQLNANQPRRRKR